MLANWCTVFEAKKDKKQRVEEEEKELDPDTVPLVNETALQFFADFESQKADSASGLLSFFRTLQLVSPNEQSFGRMTATNNLRKLIDNKPTTNKIFMTFTDEITGKVQKKVYKGKILFSGLYPRIFYSMFDKESFLPERLYICVRILDPDVSARSVIDEQKFYLAVPSDIIVLTAFNMSNPVFAAKIRVDNQIVDVTADLEQFDAADESPDVFG
jgi:hypothetical protein